MSSEEENTFSSQLMSAAIKHMQDQAGVHSDDSKKVAEDEHLQDDVEELETEVGATIDEDATAGLKKKAEKSGMPMSVLRSVYNRGVAAWKTGHRPGTTPQQWGFARVNSFVTKSSGTWGKADKDLADKVRGSKK
jgi:hypothetical protein